jgi:outer membrane protein
MKKFIAISALCLAAVAVNAQSNTVLAYSIGFPVGDMSDYIEQTSFRGISLDFRKMIQPTVGVGFSIGWNVFYEEKAYATYTLDNESISGKQYRYSNQVPMMISPAYFFRPDEDKTPFLGLGIGTMYTRRNTDMNLYTYEQEAWNFLLQPELGFQFSIDDATALSISAKYNYGFKAGNELDTPQSYFALTVGFAFIK